MVTHLKVLLAVLFKVGQQMLEVLSLVYIILQMLTIVICVTDNNFPNLLLAACTLLILKV